MVAQKNIKSCKPYFFFVFLFLFFLQEGLSQPYQLAKSQDWGLMIGGASLITSGFYLKGRVKPLTVAQIANLSDKEINDFDRGALKRYKVSDGNLSNYLLGASITAPLLLLFDKHIRQDHKVVFVMLAESIFLVDGLTNTMKAATKRNRPFVYNPRAPIEKKITKNARSSFFSGHVSNAATLSFFTAHLVSQYSNNKTVKKLVWIGAFTLPAVTGYLRYSSGKHFPTDIIAGYIVGAAVGYLVPQLHLSTRKEGRLYFSGTTNQVAIGYGF